MDRNEIDKRIGRILRWWERRHASTSGRNDAMVKLAHALNDNGIPEADALEACLPFAEGGSRPFPEREIRDVVRGVYRRHRGQHGTNPWAERGSDGGDEWTRRPVPEPEPEKPLFLHPEADVQATLHGVHKLPLLSYLMSHPAIPADRLQEAVRAYQIGRWDAPGDVNDGALVAWQRDIEGRVRAGHLIPYRDDGHRLKDTPKGFGHWAHYAIHRKSADDLGVRWCLFGEHLVPKYPDALVMIVESEKTALTMACIKPFVKGRRAVWVATGGKAGFGDRLLCLKGRDVIAWPDASEDGSTYAKWVDVAHRLEPALDITVMDTLEGITQALRTDGVDIADLYLDHDFAHPLSGEALRLKDIVQRYPAAGALTLELGTIPIRA